jgi:hypothetical protein
MSRRGRPLPLLLLSTTLACGAAIQPLRAGRATADPEQGAVTNKVYVNPYFGMRYPLPPGWNAGPQPPRPSAGGYYVLSTPTPPPDTQATILIAAQDAFFAAPPIADADEMRRNLVRSISADGENAAPISGTVEIAGRPFVKIEIPGTPLSRLVFATDIRCHVVIFSFGGAQPGRLQQLAASLHRLSLDQGASAPDCVRNYATARTIRHKVEPASAGPQFVKVPVRIVIGADGGVEHIHVIRAFAAQQQSIADALIHWQFEPHVASGKARGVETGLTFEFKPSGRPD